MQHVFSSVVANATTEIDKMGTESKKQVWGGKGLITPARWPFESALPWHWSDTMPTSVWETFCTVLRIVSVVDLSAGPTCMRSFFGSGVAYFGLCRNESLRTWLQAVADKEALKQLAWNSSFLILSDSNRQNTFG